MTNTFYQNTRWYFLYSCVHRIITATKIWCTICTQTNRIGQRDLVVIKKILVVLNNDAAVAAITGTTHRKFVVIDTLSSLKYLTHMHKCLMTDTSDQLTHRLLRKMVQSWCHLECLLAGREKPHCLKSQSIWYDEASHHEEVHL